MSETIQELQAKKKKRGRPRLSDALVTFRLPWGDLDILNAISMYEGRDKAELLRTAFLKIKKEYRKDRTFRKWVAKHAEALTKVGINPEDLF